MSLQMARRTAAAWSARRMGSTPGASSSMMAPSAPSETHCRCRVTPGRAALAHCARPISRLISALLPTFGKPTTAARTGRGRSPFSRRRSFNPSLTARGQRGQRSAPLSHVNAALPRTCEGELHEARHALAAAAVGEDDARVCGAREVGRPPRALRLAHLVHLVQHHQAQLGADPLWDARVARRQRDARVADLSVQKRRRGVRATRRGPAGRCAGSHVENDVHQPQLLLQLFLRARDVARVPLRRGGGVAAASATTLERLAGAAAPPDVRASVQRSRSQAPHDGTGPHAAV